MEDKKYTRQELTKLNQGLRLQGKKCCPKCEEVKPLEEFTTAGKLKSGKKNYRNCLICNRKRGVKYHKDNPDVNKKYREKHKERLSEISKQYYQDNKKLYSEYNKKYRVKHKEHLLEYNRQYHKNNRKTLNKKYREKLKTDELFSIKESLRKTVYHTIKEPKKFSTCEILGCDYKTFKQHIENQFEEGMTWDNYGQFGWHYDHIIPVSSAETEEELYKLNHYTNFQPLWWYDNLSKSDKLDWEQVED